MGQAERFESDLLGRVNKHIYFLGHQAQTISPNADSANTPKVTAFLSSTMLTMFDALSSTIKVADNGDPASTPTNPV